MLLEDGHRKHEFYELPSKAPQKLSYTLLYMFVLLCFAALPTKANHLLYDVRIDLRIHNMMDHKTENKPLFRSPIRCCFDEYNIVDEAKEVKVLVLYFVGHNGNRCKGWTGL